MRQKSSCKMTFRFFLALALLSASVFCEDDALIAKVTEELGAECIAEHHIDLNELKNNFVECAQTAVLPVITAISTGGEVTEAVIDVVCTKRSLKPCVDALPTALAPCLSGVKKENVDHVVHALSVAHDFACENDGQRIKDAIAHGMECITSQKEEVQKCRPKADDPLHHHSLSDMFSEESCKQEFEVNKCGSEVLGHCEDKTLKELYDGLVAEIHKETPCKQYLDH